MTRKSSNLPNMFDIFSNAWERLLSGRSKNLRAFVPPCEISPKFRSTKNSACRPIPMKHKPLRIESLENRELLSVSGWFERLTDVPTYSPLAEVREGETVFIPNQWIVQLNQSTLKNVDSVNAAANYLLPYGITVYGGLGAKGLLLVSTATVSYAPEMTSWSIFASMDCLDYWEQDSYFCTSGISSSVNDPYVKNQWGLDSIDLGNAWNTTMGSGVVVAVLDTGIDLIHPDLVNNLWKNPRELQNGVDSDGNGFKDDIYGWNFVSNSASVQDGHGHGTHVSGIIGASRNNGVGGVGVAPDVKIMTCKVLSDSGSGYDSYVISALNYIAMMRRDYGINIVVANASLGGYGAASMAYTNAVATAGTAGVVFVAAAGNEKNNNDNIACYPANFSSYSHVISVAAIGSNNQLADFSNYGRNTVNIAAPGSSIYSTVPVSQGSYAYKSGTSMAAPMVAGAIALLAAANPTLTAAQLKTLLLQNADPVTSLNGKVSTNGKLNIGNPFTRITPNVTVGEVTYNSASFTITGLQQSKYYKIQYSINGTTWIDGPTAQRYTGSALQFKVSDLNENISYQFRLMQADSNLSNWSTGTQVAKETVTTKLAPQTLTLAEYNTLRILYPELGLSVNMLEYNIVVITTLNDANLRNAVNKTGTTFGSDLIVFRTSASSNTIQLASGVLSVDFASVTYGDVMIASLGTAPLTIDARNQSQIMKISNGASVSFAGITLTGGKSTSVGGAIEMKTGNLSIINSTITRNTSTWRGGAIYNESGVISISRSTFSYNTVVCASDYYGYGGAIYLVYGATGVIKDCTFDNNSVKGSDYTSGGAIIVEGGTSSLIVSRSKFTNNSATDCGGAISVFSRQSSIFVDTCV